MWGINLPNNTGLVPNSNFVVEQPLTKQDFELYNQLRYEVLRKPWNQPRGSESDETDTESIHAFIIKDNKAIACGRVIFIDPTTAQIRTMAVHPSYQGKGLGKLVIGYLEDIARKNNRTKIILHARESAVKFYENCGYKVKETSYLLFGEIQHYLMDKTI
jgi:GNAT superfamily N-acetyltransferase